MRFLMFLIFIGAPFGVLSNPWKKASEGGHTTSCLCGVRKRASGRIVGGEDVGFGEWPMMVAVMEAISKTAVRSCGGTIVSKKHVLTAAHCLVHKNARTGKDELSNPRYMKIVFGIVDKAQKIHEGNLRKVKKFHIYEKYDSQIYAYDIALIVVTDEFPVYRDPNVMPACFPVQKYTVPVGSDVIAVGWGLTSWPSETQMTTTTKLKQVMLTTRDLAACNKLYPSPHSRFDVNHRYQTCTFNPGKSTCRGDSGGPLFWYDKQIDRYVLAGVTSFGPYAHGNQAGCTGIAGFTDTSVFIDWVNNKLKGDYEETCGKLMY